MRKENRVAHGSVKEDEGRIDWLDVAKGLSILLVVFHHAALTGASIGHGWAVFSTLDALAKPVRMPLFFAIAGLFAAGALSRSWGRLLTGRVANLVWLYSLWTVIYWLFFRYFDPTDGLKPLGLSKWQLIYMWIIPPSGQWFLWLMAIYLVLAKAIARFRSPVHLSAIFLLCALSAGPVAELPHYPWRNGLLYAPFFIGGAWYGRALAERAPRHAATLIVGGTAGFAALLMLTRHPGAQIGLSMAGLMAAVGVALLLSRISRLKGPLIFFGRRTLSIYLGHGLVIAALSMPLSVLPLGDHAFLWVTPFLMLFSLFGSLVLHDRAGSLGRMWLYSDEGMRQSLPKRFSI